MHMNGLLQLHSQWTGVAAREDYSLLETTMNFNAGIMCLHN